MSNFLFKTLWKSHYIESNWFAGRFSPNFTPYTPPPTIPPLLTCSWCKQAAPCPLGHLCPSLFCSHRQLVEAARRATEKTRKSPTLKFSFAHGERSWADYSVSTPEGLPIILTISEGNPSFPLPTKQSYYTGSFTLGSPCCGARFVNDGVVDPQEPRTVVLQCAQCLEIHRLPRGINEKIWAGLGTAVKSFIPPNGSPPDPWPVLTIWLSTVYNPLQMVIEAPPFLEALHEGARAVARAHRGENFQPATVGAVLKLVQTMKLEPEKFPELRRSERPKR